MFRGRRRCRRRLPHLGVYAMKNEDKTRYTSMKTCNLVVSAASVVLGLLIVYFSIKLGIGPSKVTGMKAGTWPGMMGAGIVTFAVILLFYTIKNAKKLGDLDFQNTHGEYVNRVTIHLPQNQPVYVVMLIIIAFSIGLRYLGFYVSGAILLPILMRILAPCDRNENKRNVMVKTLLIDAGTMIAIFVIFELGLKAKLPEPFWI